jgi:hypothetical protein
VELVLLDSRECPHCGGLLLEPPEVTYVPLFRHAGYGEATRVRAELCLQCLSVREISRETVNPRTL